MSNKLDSLIKSFLEENKLIENDRFYSKPKENYALVITHTSEDNFEETGAFTFLILISAKKSGSVYKRLYAGNGFYYIDVKLEKIISVEGNGKEKVVTIERGNKKNVKIKFTLLEG